MKLNTLIVQSTDLSKSKARIASYSSKSLYESFILIR